MAIINFEAIIKYYYKEDTPLRHILLMHSRQVADRALRICDRHPELHLDRAFLEAAAMLHDIGIIRCNAPGIQCFGTEPYILHGLIGAKMLGEYSSNNNALSFGEGGTTPDAFARVCARHTGAGISREQIIRQQLPLPLDDYLPETLEEQVICYADKFYSKSHLDQEKTLAEAEHSLMKFGEEGVARFRQWAGLFE